MFFKNISIKRDFLSKLNSVLKEKISLVMFGLLDDPVNYFLENKHIFSQSILTSMEFIETLGWREWLKKLTGNFVYYYYGYIYSPNESAEYDFLKTHFSFNEYMKRDRNYQNIQDRINYKSIIITNCFNLLENKLDKMSLWEIISLINTIQSTHHNVIRSSYSNHKNSFSIFGDNRFLSQKMSSKDFDESLAAIYNGLKGTFANEINEMIEKGYSIESKLKKEEDLCYIGWRASESLNRMRENKDFIVSQGLNFDLVNYNFVLDERIVELAKTYRYVCLSDDEVEKNLDFLEKEFSLKKF